MPFNTNDGRINAADVDECLYAVAQDDVEALSRLYALTSGAIYAYALSITKNAFDAEDVTHDVYVKAYENAHSYSSQGKPMAWLMTITKNLCYNRFRKRSKIADVTDDDLERQFAAIPRLDAEDRMVVNACLSRLSDSERQIVIMHSMTDLKHIDIARVLSIPLATVISKYNRAVKKLRRIFGKGDL